MTINDGGAGPRTVDGQVVGDLQVGTGEVVGTGRQAYGVVAGEGIGFADGCPQGAYAVAGCRLAYTITGGGVISVPRVVHDDLCQVSQGIVTVLQGGIGHAELHLVVADGGVQASVGEAEGVAGAVEQPVATTGRAADPALAEIEGQGHVYRAGLVHVPDSLPALKAVRNVISGGAVGNRFVPR